MMTEGNIEQPRTNTRKPPAPNSGRFNRAQLARRWGVCKHTLINLEKRGLLNPIRLTKRTILYTKEDVESAEAAMRS